MITVIEWLFGAGSYIGIGVAVARTQAKQIFRRMHGLRRYKNKQSEAVEAYHWSLLGWVTLWPLRTMAAVWRFVLKRFIADPIKTVWSHAADIVKEPVDSVQNVIAEAEENLRQAAEILGNPKADDEDRKIARVAVDEAYAAKEAALKDLGLQVPLRRAIESSSPSDEAIRRGLQTARRVRTGVKAEMADLGSYARRWEDS